jgi:hypothetical protein
MFLYFLNYRRLELDIRSWKRCKQRENEDREEVGNLT